MPLANGANLAKSYGAESIFQGVSFEIQERDRIALVGANGEGKSTLLRVIAGVERPDSGALTFASGTQLGYLSQEVTFPPGVTLRAHVLGAFHHLLALERQLEDVQHQIAAGGATGAHGATLDALLARHDRLLHQYEAGGGYTYQNRLREVLAGLGIEEERLDQPLESFSGGQRTRVALAELLLSGRDLLLLDEPTNHLDLEATEWLESFLAQAPQAALIVSHDRWFLDKVVTRTWELAHGELERYGGNYSQFAAQRAQRLERQRKEYEAQQEHIARTEAFIDRYRAGQRSRQARGRQKLLDRLERVERPREAGAMALSIRSTLRSGETVLATEGLVVAAATPRTTPARSPAGTPVVRAARGHRPADPGAVLFRADDVELRRGERAAVIGANGTGKTTFLRVVTGEQEPGDGRLYVGHAVQLAYYAQAHEQLRTDRSVLDEILSVKPLGEAVARTYLGRYLFSGDDVFKRVDSLSGGERSRLALAKLALGNANFLVLDEPTNHLDIYSREALEAVLRHFEGTILFVSHDRYLIDSLATQIWAIEDGRLRVYKCDWAEYLDLRARARAAEEEAKRRAKEAAAAPSLAAAEAARTRAREQARRQARLDALEGEIAALGAQLHLVTQQIEAASAAADAARIAELGSQHDDVAQRLAALEEEWLEMNEALEREPAGAEDRELQRPERPGRSEREGSAGLDVAGLAGYRSSR
jgi:ATP-binding cassette subfamily F protein 3